MTLINDPTQGQETARICHVPSRNKRIQMHQTTEFAARLSRNGIKTKSRTKIKSMMNTS